MHIIAKTPGASGAYPPLQAWQGAPPATHYLYPDALVPAFYPADKRFAGFVTLTVDGDTVTDAAWDEETYLAYCAEHPEEPEPTEPTTDERLASLEEENTLLKAQVAAQSDQMDFYEECIAEMATVVYA